MTSSTPSAWPSAHELGGGVERLLEDAVVPQLLKLRGEGAALAARLQMNGLRRRGGVGNLAEGGGVGEVLLARQREGSARSIESRGQVDEHQRAGAHPRGGGLGGRL